ncbi:SOS response-associated peptidase family protein [Sphingopyxis sp. 2PD]|uniref:SOS response-associated peptidase n=1 Tax=Sphingopyxis sp. 2PD TaxID=2502196 RepID=UPI0010F70A1D|nr:SOS response-associated peptidase family protein [Sphingopyxis sp. 2PD]
MCNLYTNKSTVAEMADLFKAQAPHGFNAPADVYPGYPGLVIRDHDGARVIEQMTWGFPVRLKGMKPTSKPKPVNNARDDKLLTPFWKHWFTTPAHRCLIPFTAFAEAEGPKGKMTRTWISVADQPTAAWAGLWRPTDEWDDAYTGVMVDATEELFDIHDRMPVILHPDAHETWLRANADEAMKLVTQYPADRLIVDRTDEPWFKPRGS